MKDPILINYKGIWMIVKHTVDCHECYFDKVCDDWVIRDSENPVIDLPCEDFSLIEGFRFVEL